MKRQKKLIVLLLVLSAVLLIAQTRAFAGPDPPVIVGSMAYYTGNQSDGIIANCPPIEVVSVMDLTTDITPLANFPGVWLEEAANNGGNGSAGSSGGHGANGFSDEIGILFFGNHGISTHPHAWFPVPFPMGLYAASTWGNGGAGGDWYVAGSAGNGGYGGFSISGAGAGTGAGTISIVGSGLAGAIVLIRKRLLKNSEENFCSRKEHYHENIT